MIRTLRYLLLLVFFISPAAFAESELSLAKTTENPLAVNPEVRHFTLPFVNYTYFDYNGNQTQNILDLKPVMPFRFTPRLDIILRTIIPITHQPTEIYYINGLGDINPTVFLTPAKNNWFVWGVGPSFILPTATNKVLGAGKWSAGPEIVLIAMPQQWVFAMLTNNFWSFAGNQARKNVNQFSFQYFITYNFPHGWYLTTQPPLTADWFAPRNARWTVPFGGGFGRTFKLGGQSVNTTMQAYDNVVRPANGARWTLQIAFEFLFPDNGVLQKQTL
jgi:hypothetical protein